MKEKRRLKRRQLLYYLQVFIRGTDTQVGNVADITHEGMMVFSRKALEKKEVFPLTVLLPEKIQDREALQVDAEVKWTRPDVQPGTVAMGFEFVNLTDVDRLVISRLIMDFRMEE